MIHKLRFPVFILVLLTVYLTCYGDNKKNKVIVQEANETYKNNCGDCHFLYQPALLPARSWEKIIDASDGHAGGPVPLGNKTKAELKKYLTQNCAENSSWKKSKKILNSATSDSPVRISESSYIKKKHREISQAVFDRKSIGTRGNCIACHRSADKGLYDEDDVIILDK